MKTLEYRHRGQRQDGADADAVCAAGRCAVFGHVGRGGCESLDALDGLDAALDFPAPDLSTAAFRRGRGDSRWSSARRG
ncbi:MAG: hypothetical protein ACLS7Z_00810 [Christensenellales bacterium]